MRLRRSFVVAGSIALLAVTSVFCAADDASLTGSDSTVVGGSAVYSIAVSGAT